MVMASCLVSTDESPDMRPEQLEKPEARSPFVDPVASSLLCLHVAARRPSSAATVSRGSRSPAAREPASAGAADALPTPPDSTASHRVGVAECAVLEACMLQCYGSAMNQELQKACTNTSRAARATPTHAACALST